MQEQTLKTATIFTATVDGVRVYHSAEDVPQSVRRRMEDAAETFHILVANRAGIHRLSQSFQSGKDHKAVISRPLLPTSLQNHRNPDPVLRTRLAILVLSLAGLALWLILFWR